MPTHDELGQKPTPPDPEPAAHPRLPWGAGIGGLGLLITLGGAGALTAWLISTDPLGGWVCEGARCDVVASWVSWDGVIAYYAVADTSLLGLVDGPEGRRAVMWDGKGLVELGGVANDADLLASVDDESWLVTGEPSYWVHGGEMTTIPGAVDGAPIFGARGAIAVPLAGGERTWIGESDGGSVVDFVPDGGAWSPDGAMLATYTRGLDDDRTLRIWTRFGGGFLPNTELRAAEFGVLWLDETNVLVRHSTEDDNWHHSILYAPGAAQEPTITELPETIDSVWNLPTADLLVTFDTRSLAMKAYGYDAQLRWKEPAVVFPQTLCTDDTREDVAGVFWLQERAQPCLFDGHTFDCAKNEDQVIVDRRVARQPHGACLAYLRTPGKISPNDYDNRGLLVAPEAYPVLWCGDDEQRLEVEGEVRELAWTESGQHLRLRTTDGIWLATAQGTSTSTSSRIGEAGSASTFEGDWVLVTSEGRDRWWYGETRVPETSEAMTTDGAHGSGDDLLTWSTINGIHTVFHASGKAVTRWQRETPPETTARIDGALVMVEVEGLRVLRER